MKIIFVSDFFVDQVSGGAEIYDDILINLLTSDNIDVIKFQSSELTDKHAKLYISCGNHFIISNFCHLNSPTAEQLMNHPGSYSVLEHDHKYLRTRDPSIYDDFLAPPNAIFNRSFYANAKNIFAQSKIHAETIAKNLKISNVINLGMSLWTDEQLQIIENNLNNEKVSDCSVVKSSNPTKNTIAAENFCKEKELPYTLIGSSDYAEFIKQLASHESHTYIPKVLESFNRVLLEARMLGCKLYTTNLNGCISEDWFKEYKGPELIEFVRSERNRVYNDIKTAIFEERKVAPDVECSDITVILNAYRRPYNLRMQIEAIRNQTKPPKQIWLWVNAHEDNRNFNFKTLNVDRIFYNDYNWKFYGRFAAALLADTEYVSIYDDDTVPGSKWHENCLNTMSEKEGILGTAGYVQTGAAAMQYYRHGWPSQNLETERVDYVGHAWFFKREWLSYLWREKPPTWDNGEDMHFSYTSQKYGNIQTYCPPHPENDKEMHGSLLGYELGVDSKATSNNEAVSHEVFFSQRDMCVRTAIDGGWDTVQNIK
jgi:hypothetical protein